VHTSLYSTTTAKSITHFVCSFLTNRFQFFHCIIKWFELLHSLILFNGSRPPLFSFALPNSEEIDKILHQKHQIQILTEKIMKLRKLYQTISACVIWNKKEIGTGRKTMKLIEWCTTTMYIHSIVTKFHQLIMKIKITWQILFCFD
jgi:hypothetical protein